MEMVAMPLADERAEVSRRDYAPPPKVEEQDLDILALELWQRANCPEEPADEYWLGEEEALRCHASCL